MHNNTSSGMLELESEAIRILTGVLTSEQLNALPESTSGTACHTSLNNFNVLL